MIIKCHPQINLDNVDYLLHQELSNTHIEGYISISILKELYNLFSWVYLKNNTREAFEDKQSSLYKVIQLFDLTKFKGDSISYSAVLFYNILNKIINIRKLEINILKTLDGNENKLLTEEEFSKKQLYEFYKKSDDDISKDMLIFNSLFIKTEDKIVEPFKNYGDIVRAYNISDLVRPDLKYKLATKSLLVSNDKNINNNVKELFILQDSSNSMKKYQDKLSSVKAFIISEAFKYNFKVTWLFVTDKINYEVEYIDDIPELKHKYYEGNVRLENILKDIRFKGKNVVIITDGTDNFNFKLNPSTKKINVITFKENMEIKNKLIGYGKYFKT